jgi:hypothetical protein
MAGIRQYFGKFQSESGPLASGDGGRMLPDSGAGRIPAPDVAGLRCRLDSDDQHLLNFNNRVSNVRVMTKNLISENDLRFFVFQKLKKLLRSN